LERLFTDEPYGHLTAERRDLLPGHREVNWPPNLKADVAAFPVSG
jgi:hypothetical protein